MKKYGKYAIFVFSFLVCVSFYTPVFASFFQAAHRLTNSQITTLFACASLATFLFEIPTGILGDKIGERKSLMIGSGLTAVSTWLFIVGSTPLLYIGEIIFGISSTFFSGPFDAMLYHYCERYENEEEYSKIVSRSYSLQWLALCVSFMGCSLLSASGNLAVPFYATLAVNILLVITAVFLPNIEKQRDKKPNDILRSAVRDIVQNGDLRRSCLLNASFLMLLVCGYQLLQPYLADSGMQASYNGWMYCAAALLGSCGSFFFEKVQKIFRSKRRILLVCILMISGCFFGLANVTGMALIFALVCCYRLIWGVTSPMFSYMVNSSISDDAHRDTVFSVISLISNLFSSVFLFLLGFFDLSSKSNYWLLGVVALLFTMIIFLSRDNKSGADMKHAS